MIKMVTNFMIKPATSSSLLDSYLPWKTKVPREGEWWSRKVTRKTPETVGRNCNVLAFN
jgi:hypothetical protein